MSEEGDPPTEDGSEQVGGLGDLVGQAREQLEKASHDAADVRVRGRAGGGAVEIELTGNLEVVSVTIAPDVVDPADISMLEDLVFAALRDALSEAVEVREQAASTLLPPGLDLGAMMNGLFGGGGLPPGIPGGVGLPNLDNIDIGDVDFGELMGELFGSQAFPSGEEEIGDADDDADDDDDQDEELS